MFHIEALFSNTFFIVSAVAFVAWVLSIRMYPVIIYVSQTKGLVDVPEGRRSHTHEVPNLGGVGLFLAFSLTMILFAISVGLGRPELVKLLSVLGATIILLFLGIKDDLVLLSPRKKFIGQFIAAGIVIFATDLRIQDFEGLLGIGELPYWVSVGFTFFVFLLMVNAYNLIDGIDGLAGVTGIVASLFFGVFFALNEALFLAMVSFALTGAIIGFLGFNFSKTQKLFMGDSGSLFIGFLLTYLGIGFLGMNESAGTSFVFAKSPVLLMAVMSFPLFDTLRVFILRIRKGRSPFVADRNHIHHRLLDVGLSHVQATIYIAVSNVLLIELVLLMGDLYINVQLFISVLVGSLVYLLPFSRFFEKHIVGKIVETQQGKIIGEGQETRTSGMETLKPVFMGPKETGMVAKEIATKKIRLGEEGIVEIKKSEKPKIPIKRVAN
ncbi:undecaprenyl/decaprenyl-phosphate alpha-N-acetylglucosaminyl 1-phosphate transferase [Maribacter sp. ANRC-HE7]|uniref:Undecaprenyl/decaprenyl-phosphate alpha-N-acetylglucosaminyl 1-phosphate transferase n=1 Tax=Maribacter aquimaris TaxID=2737171 RepID=A0ABR7V467_9FLAO|nr:MraY family glycosyltransferase [Maribacter aquimaris]MBD0778101.1 undecaprenyl/decaprenyl-phosphate alpha-N-acetylglucosaminyl 1-phosphate transferase [Maribacter aquimaris]